MATLSIRNVDEGLKARLKKRAAARGRSMGEEASRILRDVLDREAPDSLADLATELFGMAHGVELDIHPTTAPPPAPDFADA